MAKPRVLVLRTAGTNCDRETVFAFEKTGAQADLVHINQLLRHDKSLSGYQILAIPGGFTYGDDIAAGRVLANELRYKLTEDISRFVSAGKLIIGICNGFQILVKSGLLPGNDDLKQEVSLVVNDSNKFEDRWVYLKLPSAPVTQSPVKCVWTKGLPEIIYLPIAHGEGKFITKDKAVLERLKNNGQIVFQYCNQTGKFSGYPDNPNGSEVSIAGICDETGRILGLMPHPERHIFYLQHPRWKKRENSKEGDGIKIFRSGIAYVNKHL